MRCRTPAIISAAALIACLAACADPSTTVHALPQAIIDGAAAPAYTGVVRLWHRDRGDDCSGVMVASDLLLTAKHCVCLPDGEPRPADGFHVAFGADDERFEERGVSALRWVGMPEVSDIPASVAAGHDAALLVLEAGAPEGTQLHPVAFGYVPRAGDPLSLLGFGLHDTTTGRAGVRRIAGVEPAGYDPGTGVLQVSGGAACFGDSGGPLLLTSGDVAGVVSEVGASDAGVYCVTGQTFAMTLANTELGAMLESACDERGGCGPQIPRPDAGAPPQNPIVAAQPPVGDSGLVSESHDSGVYSTASNTGDQSGCTCRATGASANPGSTFVLYSTVLLSALWRRRAKAASQSRFMPNLRRPKSPPVSRFGRRSDDY